MRVEKLVSMANQIAAFFRSYPEAEAVAGINRHLHAFWTPTMVSALQDHLAHEPEGVDTLVAAAMRRNPLVDSPTDKALSPAREGGLMASDAG